MKDSMGMVLGVVLVWVGIAAIGDAVVDRVRSGFGLRTRPVSAL